MPVRLSVLTAASSIIAAATIFDAPAAAAGHPIPVSIHLSTRGVDLGNPTEARRFYEKLKYAATVVCTHGDKAGLEPLPSPKDCADKSLADAIRSVNAPRLLEIFLETHTVRQASALGIIEPPKLAAH
jgi:UrcA family protein